MLHLQSCSLALPRPGPILQQNSFIVSCHVAYSYPICRKPASASFWTFAMMPGFFRCLRVPDSR